MALDWKGDELKRKMRRAQVTAIDTTMAACVLKAKEDHGPGAHGSQRFESQTGELERSIRIVDPAKEDNAGAAGTWGSKNIAYARRIEMGFQGKDALGRVYDQAAFPFLQPAANDQYPKLADRVREELEHQA